MTITQRTVNALRPKESDYFVRDDQLTGFGVKVTPKGRKSFIVEGRIRGSKRTRRITLGQFPTLSVQVARERAREHLSAMQAGIDPVEAQRAQEEREAALARTLRSVFEEYLSVRDRTPKTVRDYEGTMRLVYGDWLDRPIREITRPEIQDRFRETEANRGLSTAGKASRILSAIFNYAMAEEIDGARLITENPVHILKQRRLNRVPPRRETYLREQEIGELYHFYLTVKDWPETPEHGVSDQGMNLVMLIMCTGLRKGEALGLLQEDVDFANRCFTVRDTKNGTDHTVPISGLVETILENQINQHPDSDYVFPARYGDGHMTEPKSQLAKIRKATGLKFTLHDLRRTFATHASANGIGYEAIRLALNHKSGGGVTAGYIIHSVENLRHVFEAVAEGYATYYEPDWRHELEAAKAFEEDLKNLADQDLNTAASEQPTRFPDRS